MSYLITSLKFFTTSTSISPKTCYNRTAEYCPTGKFTLIIPISFNLCLPENICYRLQWIISSYPVTYLRGVTFWREHHKKKRYHSILFCQFPTASSPHPHVARKGNKGKECVAFFSFSFGINSSILVSCEAFSEKINNQPTKTSYKHWMQEQNLIR